MIPAFRSRVHRFLSCRRIAVVGVSRDGKSFSRSVFGELRRRGYDAISLAYRGDDASAGSSSAEELRRYAGWVAERPLPERLPIDVQAVLTVLGRRARTHERNEKLDLRDTDLRGALLDGAHLDQAEQSTTILDPNPMPGAAIAALPVRHLPDAWSEERQGPSWKKVIPSTCRTSVSGRRARYSRARSPTAFQCAIRSSRLGTTAPSRTRWMPTMTS